MKTNTLTKEQKEAWLVALKSGQYKQCQVALEANDEKLGKLNCCLGVFCVINNINIDSVGDAYDYLKEKFSDSTLWKITDQNDNSQYWIENPDKRDYSNVIPLIEQLETID